MLQKSMDFLLIENLSYLLFWCLCSYIYYLNFEN